MASPSKIVCYDGWAGSSIPSRAVPNFVIAIWNDTPQVPLPFDVHPTRRFPYIISVKYFTSFKWKNRFADVAQEFISHKEGIHHDLQIHISSEITEANATLKIVNQNVSLMMSVVFEHMCTAEELDIASFVEEHKGIEAVVGNEQLLKQLMEKQQKRTERSGDKSDKAQPLSLQDLQKELAKGVDEVLAENSKIFERNFAGLEISLKDVKVTIHREGDRVIAEILANISAGPHERIIDRVRLLV